MKMSKKIKKSKGISLIVLVVTILVLSILAATVIISLSNTNIIMEATNAKNAADIANMKEAANLIYANSYLEKNGTVTRENIVAGLKSQGFSDEQIDLIKIEVKDGEVTIQSKQIYGIRREVGSTSSAWERIENSKGLVTAACHGTVSDVHNDFDNIYPWSDIVSYNYDTEKKEITAYYGDNNYKTDGSNGDVLTKIPEFYYKREQKQEGKKLYEYIYVSEFERPGYSKSEEFSIGRYMSSFNTDGTSLKSVANANVATNKNIVQFRTLAKTADYTLLDYRYLVLQMLYLVEYADYNSQLMLGSGNTNFRYDSQDKAILTQSSSNTITIALTNLNTYKVGQQIDIGTGSLGSRASSTEMYRTITKIEEYRVNGELKGQTVSFDGNSIDIVSGSHGIWSCAQNTGSADALGMKSGYVGTNGYSAVIYRGVEDFFGNAFQFVDGMNAKSNGDIYINYKPETYESDKFDGDYQKLGYAMHAAKPGYGWTTTFGYDATHPLLALATEVSSDINKSITKDYSALYWGTNFTSNRVVLVGGHYPTGIHAGAFYWNVYNSSSSSNIYLASRVLK